MGVVETETFTPVTLWGLVAVGAAPANLALHRIAAMLRFGMNPKG